MALVSDEDRLVVDVNAWFGPHVGVVVLYFVPPLCDDLLFGPLVVVMAVWPKVVFIFKYNNKLVNF